MVERTVLNVIADQLPDHLDCYCGEPVSLARMAYAELILQAMVREGYSIAHTKYSYGPAQFDGSSPAIGADPSEKSRGDSDA